MLFCIFDCSSSLFCSLRDNSEPPGDLDVGFVDEPTIPAGVSARSCRVDQQWGEPCTHRNTVTWSTSIPRSVLHQRNSPA